MATAFQRNAFQDNAFQIDAVVPPVTEEVSGKWHDRYRRIDLEALQERERDRARLAEQQTELDELVVALKQQPAPKPVPAPQPRLDVPMPFSGIVGTQATVDRLKTDTLAAAKAQAAIEKQRDEEDAIALLLLL